MSRVAIPALLLIGCQGEREQSSVHWSTKSGSVLGKDLQNSRLSVVEFDLNNASYAKIRDVAIELLLEAVDADDPLLRANSIEALHAVPKYLAPAVQRGLVDKNHGVRYVAAMTVGQLQMRNISHLLEPLLDDKSLSVRGAAIYGLKRCDRAVDLSPLGAMILSEHAEVRANTAFILGELGNPTAIPLLRMAAKSSLSQGEPARKKIVNLQITEALVKLGAVDELEVIRASLFTPSDQGEIIALACQICGRLGDMRVVPNLLDLALREGRFQQSAEVRMAAAMAVAQIAPEKAPQQVPHAYLKSPYPGLRAQAVLTLGIGGDMTNLGDLSMMLSDDNPVVQVAAAGAILRISGEIYGIHK